MIFSKIKLPDAWIIEPEPIEDSRGSFSRVFCANEFRERGLETEFVQHSVSRNIKAGTLRGMHFQSTPHEEAKVVTCLKGGVFDVIVDLRPGSPTFLSWEGVELTEGNKRRLYIPKGFAHGFQTLIDDTELLYLISEFYVPEAGNGVGYDDPAFGIKWPLPVSSISEKDLQWQDFMG